ncbi:PREDICTED: polynucleotide 5'-hydroxyl-kinase NOL9 [Chrysochloris asiatica]|uniref:Polynucleotide 5'-hydroxyl-kinase NOL9 n=1 Tax=Chrysochloris asiatica TaxID=185453 RepID=A0A9B0TXG1_CHRAS|nr:PREDICTED: polynucleotide 5'-hydroxyl-kinase NOL9 [Chrysochloris asiatica]
MADSLQLVKRGPFRFVRSRARKAWHQLILSRRLRCRPGPFRWCGRRRLRRRLLRAQAAGVDWREGGCQVSGAAAEVATRGLKAKFSRPKTSLPRPAPAATSRPAPAATPAPSRAPAVPTSPRIPPPLLAGPGRAVMLLPIEKSFVFGGICRVTCLYGRVQVFGFTISQGQPAYEVFSAYTNSLLSITAVHYPMPEKSKKEMKREARRLLRAHLMQGDRCKLMKNFSPLCSIVMLEHLKTSPTEFIISHLGLSYVFLQETPTSRYSPEYLTLKSVGIMRSKRKNGLQLSDSVISAVDELVSVSCEEIDGCPVILVCGCQDIGKSTFNRYLINQLLNCIPCIDYLECDLGQTEFTPPGCISLFNITEPVLGPPFTHQRTPQKMVYYGKTTCKDNYEHYIEIIKYVFNSYKRESPLIINTMGWVTDNGLLLLIDLIRLLSPSHVVQFSSGRSKYMPNLTPDYVDDIDGLYTKSRPKMRNRGFNLPEAENLEFIDEERGSPVVFSGHKLMCVRSEFTFRKTPRNRESHNRVLRELAVLGYLGKLQPPDPKLVSPIQDLTPYQVPFNAVALRIMHADVAPTHILYAVNASWVGLCRIQDDVRGYVNGPILLAQTPLCDCVGFGICRGIDMEKRLYHILTPVPPQELRNVNCLLIGAVSIPHCVFKSQRGPEGMIPYITTDYNFSLPGARDKVGARDSEQTDEEKKYLRSKLFRKINLY